MIVDEDMTSGIAVVTDVMTFGVFGKGVVPGTIVEVAVGWTDGAVEVQPPAKITRINPSVRIQILRICIA